MSEPADFLSRWSRRKRAAAEGVADEPVAAETPEEARAAPDDVKAPTEVASPTKPAFDITELPSLDSIGPDTDIRMFLQPGVPAALKHAALRRVWVSDPAIRDFRAPQEMDWDFNSPGLSGFGEIGPDVDVKKMVARIFGGGAADEAAPAPQPSATVTQVASSEVESQSESENYISSADNCSRADAACTEGDTAMLHGDKDIAPQQDEPESQLTKPRRHGGALPQ